MYPELPGVQSSVRTGCERPEFPEPARMSTEGLAGFTGGTHCLQRDLGFGEVWALLPGHEAQAGWGRGMCHGPHGSPALAPCWDPTKGLTRPPTPNGGIEPQSVIITDLGPRDPSLPFCSDPTPERF